MSENTNPAESSVSKETNVKDYGDLSFTVAIKDSPSGTVLVITDTDLIGQKFEEGKLQLDLSNSFYKGEIVLANKLPEMVAGSYVVHITGKKAVEFVKSLGYINSEKVIVINGVPHAEVYLG